MEEPTQSSSQHAKQLHSVTPAVGDPTPSSDSHAQTCTQTHRVKNKYNLLVLNFDLLLLENNFEMSI